jgi:hypothetical protein
MDATISYDEVAALVGINIPTLEPRPNFERIRTLRRHFERALQRLPCPQSIQHGWKGMVMARELYALLTIHRSVSPPTPERQQHIFAVRPLGNQSTTPH